MSKIKYASLSLAFASLVACTPEPITQPGDDPVPPPRPPKTETNILGVYRTDNLKHYQDSLKNVKPVDSIRYEARYQQDIAVDSAQLHALYEWGNFDKERADLKTVIGKHKIFSPVPTVYLFELWDMAGRPPFNPENVFALDAQEKAKFVAAGYPDMPVIDRRPTQNIELYNADDFKLNLLHLDDRSKKINATVENDFLADSLWLATTASIWHEKDTAREDVNTNWAEYGVYSNGDLISPDIYKSAGCIKLKNGPNNTKWSVSNKLDSVLIHQLSGGYRTPVKESETLTYVINLSPEQALNNFDEIIQSAPYGAKLQDNNHPVTVKDPMNTFPLISQDGSRGASATVWSDGRPNYETVIIVNGTKWEYNLGASIPNKIGKNTRLRSPVNSGEIPVLYPTDPEYMISKTVLGRTYDMTLVYPSAETLPWDYNIFRMLSDAIATNVVFAVDISTVCWVIPRNAVPSEPAEYQHIGQAKEYSMLIRNYIRNDNPNISTRNHFVSGEMDIGTLDNYRNIMWIWTDQIPVGKKVYGWEK